MINAKSGRTSPSARSLQLISVICVHSSGEHSDNVRIKSYLPIDQIISCLSVSGYEYHYKYFIQSKSTAAEEWMDEFMGGTELSDQSSENPFQSCLGLMYDEFDV